MSEAANFKKLLRRRLAVFLCGYFLFLSLVFYVMEKYIMPDSSRSDVDVMVALGLLLVMFLFFYIFYFPKEKASYLADHYPGELDRMALSFQKEADEVIFRRLGQENFQQIMEEECMCLDGTCQKLVAGEEGRADPDLRCYLLARLANSFIKEDIYERAAACLEEAVSLKPDNLLLNLRLAEVHEALGSGEKAVYFYQIAAGQASSAEIKSYLHNQMERVKTTRPRKAAPMPGFRYFVG